jgi:hypothetical protein
MAVLFRQENHSYESVDKQDQRHWLSVTSLVSKFKHPFNAMEMSVKSSRNKKSKWYGMEPEKIREAWDAEALRAITLGTWYHEQRESDLLACQTIQRAGVNVPIVRPIFEDGVKFAPDQQLTEGVYPEHFVYLKSANICGQADRVEVIGNVIDLYDYKTNKEIKKESYRNWEGKAQVMLPPLDHLDDCNFYHYALQLSLYMYMMIKHNPHHKPGKLILHHITFEESGKDKYGNPINKRDIEGNPIVKAVTPYELPYLKAEVISMINWLHDNQQELR